MAEEGQELASLDFANLIGGPLNAIVEAQAKSAITTAEFIRQVGFDNNDNIVNVKFRYERTDDQGLSQDFELSVPFLTMVPIPYITVDEASVEFNAKITSVRESQVDTTISNNTSAEVKGGWFVRAKVNTQTSYQQQRSDTAKVERSYDMHVLVKVRNADMPRGTERILDILQNVITQKPVSHFNAVSGLITKVDADTKTLTLSTVDEIGPGWQLFVGDQPVAKLGTPDLDGKTVTVSELQSGAGVDFAKMPAGVAFEARDVGENAQAGQA